jgi:hypothetical protein
LTGWHSPDHANACWSDKAPNASDLAVAPERNVELRRAWRALPPGDEAEEKRIDTALAEIERPIKSHPDWPSAAWPP